MPSWGKTFEAFPCASLTTPFFCRKTSTNSHLLRALQWRVNPPTPLTQAKHLLFILPKNVHRKGEILEITRFLTEISVCDYFFVPHTLSTVALAALYSAFDIAGESVVSEGTKSYFVNQVQKLTGLDSFTEDVQVCMGRMKHSFHQSGFSLSTFDIQVADEKKRPDKGGVSPVCVADVQDS